MTDIDLVPDPVRNFRLHEYLHRFYRRDAQVGPFVLYKSRNLPVTSPPSATFDQAQLMQGQPLSTNGLTVTPGTEAVVDFEARCSAPIPFQIAFGSNKVPDLCGAPGFSRSSEWTAFRVRSPLAFTGTLTSVTFTANVPNAIEARNVHVSVSPKAADLDLPPDKAVFNVQFLPYLWGQYDPRHAAQSQPVLWESKAVTELQPGQGLRLDVNLPVQDSAFVRVEASSPAGATLVFNYAKDSVPLSTIKGFRFNIRPRERALYMLRPSVQSFWFGDRTAIRQLMLWNDSKVPVTIYSIASLTGD